MLTFIYSNRFLNTKKNNSPQEIWLRNFYALQSIKSIEISLFLSRKKKTYLQ